MEPECALLAAQVAALHAQQPALVLEGQCFLQLGILEVARLPAELRAPAPEGRNLVAEPLAVGKGHRSLADRLTPRCVAGLLDFHLDLARILARILEFELEELLGPARPAHLPGAWREVRNSNPPGPLGPAADRRAHTTGHRRRPRGRHKAGSQPCCSSVKRKTGTIVGRGGRRRRDQLLAWSAAIGARVQLGSKCP